ncbi:MAG: glycosyltransferase family 39 protein, partial [Deltaproteobacteria bacterium]|nr:glycosyltransferase family 39 protein [Deltaproteobacteria bacterium]
MDATGLKLRDYGIALLLFALSFSALGLAQRDEGVMRDEATYFQAAESYWRWFEELGTNYKKGHTERSLTVKAITRHWSTNHEHPVLLKTLFGLSWRIFRTTDPHHGHRPGIGPGLGWMSEISAFRLPGWFFTALAVALLYLFGVRIESRLTGIVAALAYITIPRVFFHGQLACFDSAVTTMWLLVVYAYYRALDRARWGLLAGLIFGLALATKHNAWFIPALLLIHYLIVIWPDVSLRPLHLPRAPLVFFAMAILGPAVFYAHWPWLWFDTIKHLTFYFTFHLKHSYYNIEYLGHNWGLPPLPLSYPFGMTLFTVPLVILLLALIGIWIYFRHPSLTFLRRWFRLRPPPFDDRFRYPAKRSWLRPAKGLDPRIGLLLTMNAVFPLLLIALPSTPIFGGTKHWLPAYPFIALLAGVSISRLVTHLRNRGRLLRVFALLLPLLVALPGAINLLQTHPFELSQYNALAGGPAGGAALGLNRQFWGYAPRQLLPWLNRTAPKNTSVYFHDMNPGSHQAYIRNGLLRNDIRYSGYEKSGIASSRMAMVVHELHFNKYDYWIWAAYGTPVPVKVLSLDGLPLVSLYARPGTLTSKPRPKPRPTSRPKPTPKEPASSPTPP